MTMTTERPRPVRRRKPSPRAVITVSATIFFSTFGFLAFQLARGEDPALGPRAVAGGSGAENGQVTRPSTPLGSNQTGSEDVPSTPAPVVTESS